MKNYSWKDWVIAGLLALTVVTWVGTQTSVPYVLAQTATTTTTASDPAAPAPAAGTIESAPVVNADAPVVVVQDPVVTIPYGQWIVAAQELIYPLLAALIAWGMRALPSSIVSIIRTAKVDQLLLKALQAAVNQVAGASKDKKMDVKIANDVVRKIVQYAVNEGPGWLIRWMGGVEGIKAKAIARIQVLDGQAIKPEDIDVSDIVPQAA